MARSSISTRLTTDSGSVEVALRLECLPTPCADIETNSTTPVSVGLDSSAASAWIVMPSAPMSLDARGPLAAVQAWFNHYPQVTHTNKLKPANNGAQDWQTILWGVQLPGLSAGQSIGAGTNSNTIN